MKENKLYIVIPCYNEEEVLQETNKQVLKKMETLIKEKKISKLSRIMYINDGSKDNTWNIIEKLSKENKMVSGVKLSRNKGHQNALLAGLMTAKKNADIVISMDADLQDDINAIDKMIEKYYEGCEIVYGVRSSRQTDTVFKKYTAQGFYKLMAKLGVNIVYNHADYRLMSKKTIEELEKFKEVNLFLRGIVPLIGYNTSTVEYARNERLAGESKYPLKKMISFAVEGILSFSVKPIRIITVTGLFISLMSFLFMIYVFISYFMNSRLVDGWTTIIILIGFLGGFQILSIGLIGEYIGKIYQESKARPRYTIEKVILDDK